MTFDQYVTYVGTPENLAREAGWWLGPHRRDFSGLLRAWYERVRLSDVQVGAIRWLAEQPNGPAKVLAISEEWSSDCRRDVPMLAHLAEAGGMELRIFPRDGQTVGRGPKADPAIYHRARLAGAMQAAKSGENREQAWARFMRDWAALQQSPFFPMWASAGVDEILSALHERIVVGALA